MIARFTVVQIYESLNKRPLFVRKGGILDDARRINESARKHTLKNTNQRPLIIPYITKYVPCSTQSLQEKLVSKNRLTFATTETTWPKIQLRFH